MARTMKPAHPLKNGARFHIPDRLGPGAELALPDIAAHHAVRVLRLAERDPVVVFDGSGGEYDAVITHVHRGDVRVKTGRLRDGGPESPVSIMLVQGVSSADRMDLTVRKAVELGVSRILPIFTQRSVVKLDGNRVDRRRAHWQGIAISACEQCGRNLVPEVEEPVGFETWLAALPREPQDGESRVFLSVDGAIRLRELPAPTGTMLLLAGPEGGFAPSEADLVMTRAFTPVRLGPRVLRTETAAIAAISAIQTLWGDF